MKLFWRVCSLIVIFQLRVTQSATDLLSTVLVQLFMRDDFIIVIIDSNSKLIFYSSYNNSLNIINLRINSFCNINWLCWIGIWIPFLINNRSSIEDVVWTSSNSTMTVELSIRTEELNCHCNKSLLKRVSFMRTFELIRRVLFLHRKYSNAQQINNIDHQQIAAWRLIAYAITSTKPSMKMETSIGSGIDTPGWHAT